MRQQKIRLFFYKYHKKDCGFCCLQLLEKLDLELTDKTHYSETKTLWI